MSDKRHYVNFHDLEQYHSEKEGSFIYFEGGVGRTGWWLTLLYHAPIFRRKKREGSMATLVWVIFGIQILSLIIGLVNLITEEYPIDKAKSVGNECAGVIINLGFVVWIAVVLFL